MYVLPSFQNQERFFAQSDTFLYSNFLGLNKDTKFNTGSKPRDVTTIQGFKAHLVSSFWQCLTENVAVRNQFMSFYCLAYQSE